MEETSVPVAIAIPDGYGKAIAKALGRKDRVTLCMIDDSVSFGLDDVVPVRSYMLNFGNQDEAPALFRTRVLCIIGAPTPDMWDDPNYRDAFTVASLHFLVGRFSRASFRVELLRWSEHIHGSSSGSGDFASRSVPVNPADFVGERGPEMSITLPVTIDHHHVMLLNAGHATKPN